MSNPILPFTEEPRRHAAVYNLATAAYDEPAIRFSIQVAQRLVELAQPKPGGSVLDVTPDFGTVAFVGWSHVVFLEGDLEQLQFPDDMFDYVLCSSAIFLLPDMTAGLREWRRVLKPGGIVAFSSYGERTFQPLAKLFETCTRGYGVNLAPRPFAWQRLTDLEACSDLLRNAAFSVIDVRSEQLGYYLANREEWWDILWQQDFRTSLAELSPEALSRFKAEHLAAVAELATERGIWLNVAAIFALGQKG